LGLDVRELCGDAKVSYLDPSRLREENVGGFDVAVDLVGLMEVVEAEEELAADDGDVGFVERSGFQLWESVVFFTTRDESGLLTKSKHDPPPRNSMTIHSLTPLTKEVLYCVTNWLVHVLSRAISCCISAMVSSLPSRSIYAFVRGSSRMVA